MPKEKVWSNDSDFSVHVGWSDGTVQLGVTTADNTPLVTRIDDLAEFSGVWSTLDRSDINTLIGLLRKARNNAYGVDA